MTNKDTYQSYKITDELWSKIEPLLPPEPTKIKGGRHKIDDRKMIDAIFYKLRNDCKWRELPINMGVASTIYNRFREWRKSGLFQRMWNAGILEYDELRSLVRYGRNVSSKK